MRRLVLLILLTDYYNVFSVTVDINDKQEMMKIIKSTIGTKFIKKWYMYYLAVGYL